MKVVGAICFWGGYLATMAGLAFSGWVLLSPVVRFLLHTAR